MIKEENKIIKMKNNKSDLMIRFKILLLMMVKKMNTEIFLFSVSLSVTLLFGYLIGGLIFIPLISHFLIWILFSEKILNKKEMEEDNQEISDTINELKNKIKK